MSSKCAICETNIFGEGGQGYGYQFKNGKWICNGCEDEISTSARCEVPFCHNNAAYEGWMRTESLLKKMQVCEAHKSLLIGSENNNV